jgi:hypothetical protein
MKQIAKGDQALQEEVKTAEVKTAEQLAEEKAEQLTKIYKETKGIFKVHPIVFRDEKTGDVITGFVKEPSRMAKMAVMDKALMGSFSAVEEILDSVLIKEESDQRMWSESQEFDDIRMGLVMAVYNLIRFKSNTLKKK